MKLETIKMPGTNRFLRDYLTDHDLIKDFFHFEYNQDAFYKRLDNLRAHPVEREELSTIIRGFMEPFGISEKAEQHISELKEDAYVVIGGQQAGILTGPLYSIHKAISIILMAKKQREILGVPVVPVFWIAGEDHDLDEINHTYSSGSGKIRKHSYPVPYMKKSMATETPIDIDKAVQLIDEVFREFGETVHTDGILSDVKTILSNSKTFTDFFAGLINSLFKEEGLLLIDAAYGPLRIYESRYFQQLIELSPKIAGDVFEKEKYMESLGYGKPVDVSDDAAHLFYLHQGERVLLKREGNLFINENSGISFSKEELLAVAKTNPQLLSNNVITRPLMQEMVFPVLSFVGGPGEIAYWGLLKEAFESAGMQMPIIAPRLSITLVTRQVEQILREEGLSVEDVFNGKAGEKRELFLNHISDKETEKIIEQTEAMLKQQYEKIMENAERKRHLTPQLIEKNLSFHTKQLNYLKFKMEENIHMQHDSKLKRFDTVESQLMPENGLQERIYSPYMFLNQYGHELVRDLLKLNYQYDGQHHIVYL